MDICLFIVFVVVRVTAHPLPLGTLCMNFEPNFTNALDKGKSAGSWTLKGDFIAVYITKWWGNMLSVPFLILPTGIT